MMLILKSRWGNKLEFEWKGDLISTLREANEYTINNNLPGYFFEMEDADKTWLETYDCKVPFFKNIYGVVIGPVDYSVDV